jgi:hypothetical protein
MSTQTFTAPKAYITIENQVAGYVRNISFTENIQRTDIRGLGNLYAQESPAISASNTFSVDMFFIDFDRPVVKKLLNRTGGIEALINTLSLGDLPISINIYKREVKAVDTNSKLVTEVDKTGKEIAVLRNCFVDSQNWTLAEGGIASMTTSGRYLSPVAFNQ